MYKLTGDENIVLRIDDQLFIPKGHPFWKEYEAWLAEGNTPEPQFTEEEMAAKQLAIATAQLNVLTRQANAQVTALEGRVSTIEYTINEQDPDDPEYIEPLPEEIAELPVRKAQLKSWNSYRTKLGRVNLQATWPAAVLWPAVPEPYTSEMSARNETSV
jgi:hypothetical protein